MNTSILTSLPENHWLADYKINDNQSCYTRFSPNRGNYNIIYSIFSEIPSNSQSLYKKHTYAGSISCMGYPLDIASLLKCKKAYYPQAGLNGINIYENLDIPYNISITIAYYEPAVKALLQAAKNWDFKINEMFHINDVFVFTGTTDKWFYTKWKLQALLHLYRIHYCHTLERTIEEDSNVRHSKDLYELAKEYIPNIPELTLYNVEDVKKIDCDDTLNVEYIDLDSFSKLSQERYELNSHSFGIAEFSKILLNHILKNPFTKITTGMFLKIRSRHPSHNILRRKIRTGSKKVVFRLGSTSEVLGIDYEINSIEAIRNSANKNLMKIKFLENNVRTAVYIFPSNETQLTEWITNNNLNDKKLIIKSLTGSRGRGLYLMENSTQAIEFFASKGYGNHIIEKYYNYNREYRLHVSKHGCFYTNRKMLRQGAQERWYRNDSNCTWILETNPQFNKPENWRSIEEECVKALNAVGLDIGACDVRVASNNNNFIICEINSAPSFGEITAQKYEAELNRLIQQLD